MGHLDEPALHAAEAAVLRLGARQDGACEEGAALPPSLQATPRSAEPGVLLAQGRLCALWKPSGWSVSVSHSGDNSLEGDEDEGPRGEASGGQAFQDWIASRLGGNPIALDAGAAYGLVHRLDRDTSGAILWARGYAAHYAARLQFACRRVRKEYVCLCHGRLPAAPLELTTPLLKVASRQGPAWRSVPSPEGARAHTSLRGVGHLSLAGEAFSLVRVSLHTGQLHQIRAHLSGVGHPLVGDATYGSEPRPWCPRFLLHARGLGIDIGDGPLRVEVPLPQEFCEALRQLTPADAAAQALLEELSRG